MATGIAIGLMACSREPSSPGDTLLYQPALYQPQSAQAVVGNPEGNISIVEFFDYHCVACNAAYPALQSLLQMNPDVRVVYREIPILGEVSVFAARAAVASMQQDKYVVMHDALMNVGPALTDRSVLLIAAHLHVDISQLMQGMNSVFVSNLLSQNMQYQQILGISGTPSYVIAITPWRGTQLTVHKAVLVQGAMTVADFERVIDQLGVE